MTEFKPYCPKCGSRGGVSVFRERTNWSREKGEAVMHCHKCGKQMFGAAAETELQRQMEAWNLREVEVEPVPVSDPQVQAAVDLGIKSLLEERRAAFQEMSEHLVTAEGCVQQVRMAQHTHQATGMDFQLVSDVVDLEVMAIQRLANEVMTLSSMIEVQRRIEETRRRMQNLRAKTKVAQQEAEKEAVQRKAAASARKTPASAPKVTAPQPTVAPTPPKVVRPIAVKSTSENGKCAWQDCKNPAREGSVYCSTECRVANARWAHKQRKKQAAIGGGEVLAPEPSQVAASAPVEEPTPVVVPVATTASVKVDLEAMTLHDLRRYATHHLKVERASKIPGGKPVLLALCKRALQQADHVG